MPDAVHFADSTAATLLSTCLGGELRPILEFREVFLMNCAGVAGAGKESMRRTAGRTQASLNFTMERAAQSGRPSLDSLRRNA